MSHGSGEHLAMLVFVVLDVCKVFSAELSVGLHSGTQAILSNLPGKGKVWEWMFPESNVWVLEFYVLQMYSLTEVKIKQ